MKKVCAVIAMIVLLAGAGLSLSAIDAKSQEIKISQEQVELVIKLATEGYVKAQFNLGLMYEHGQGVRQNYWTAKEWYGKACDNGEQLGCDWYKEFNEKGY